jgi:redox-sensing transcriptional repressor
MCAQDPSLVPISQQTIKRIPFYLEYLKSACVAGKSNISAAFMAGALNLNEVQVRKDLAAVSRAGGRPKTGYAVQSLIADIEDFLGLKNVDEAVLVGAGHLGKALISYKGFEQFGLRIIAAFDSNDALAGTEYNGVMIFPMYKLIDLAHRLSVRIGIITVPAAAAQDVCDMLVKAGCLAIWNFAPVRLNVPEEIMVHNENMAASLVLLSRHLKKRFDSEAKRDIQTRGVKKVGAKVESFKRETLQRFESQYLPYFWELLGRNQEKISVEEVAEKFRVDEQQVRQEMADLTGSGQLRSEYDIHGLITKIESYLGYYNCSDVATVGWGKTAKALLKNEGFARNGLFCSYVFDLDIRDEIRLDLAVIRPLSDLGEIAGRIHLHLGILAVEPEKAQEAADWMVQSGILAIWNVSGAAIKTPPQILVADETFGEHEDMENNEAIALSLAALARQLSLKMGWDQLD